MFKNIFALLLCCSLAAIATTSQAEQLRTEKDLRVLLGNLLTGSVTFKGHTHVRVVDSRNRPILTVADTNVTIKTENPLVPPRR